MPFPPSPEDRPDPNENMPAMRARVPEHVAKGEISTGVIVVTGGTEYVLDFVRNLPRPNMIVARVVLPHMVMPQFIDALAANIELFRQRYGELPGAPNPAIVSQPFNNSPGSHPQSTNPNGGAGLFGESNSVDVWPGSDPASAPSSNANEPTRNPGQMGATSGGGAGGGSTEWREETSEGSDLDNQPAPKAPGPPPQNPSNLLKRQNPQEVYDDLKLKDEILSGAYANAVMIGHGPFEFSFDFITNFYPQSAVSCRVYLASGHIYRLLESLRASWEQLKPRLPPQPPRG
jgi:hypothetical protein